MKFEYEAIDKDDEIHTGIVEAHNFKDVLHRLYQKRLFPTNIKQISESTANGYVRLAKLKKLKRKLERPLIDLEKTILSKAEKESKPFKDHTYLFFILLIIVSVVLGILI